MGPDGVYQITHVNSNKDLKLLSLSLYLIFFICYCYIVTKLEISNKHIERLYPVKPDMDFTIPTAGLLSKEEENALLKSKKMIRKFKLAWYYSPDKAEQWLEEMESKGYNLYRMSKWRNNFYFIVGTPRKIKYAVDYQIQIGSTYYNINTECGWKLIFTSPNYQGFTVWSHECGNNGDTQEFYSDEQSKLKHAKKFALSYSLTLLPLCVLHLLVMIQIFCLIIKMNLYSFFFIIILLQTLLIIAMGTFPFKTIFYYLRIKKQLRDK
jgi:hypothetical protein